MQPTAGHRACSTRQRQLRATATAYDWPVRLTWVTGKDGVVRGYHRQTARPVAEVHYRRVAPLWQDRYVVFVEGVEVDSSHHPRLAQEMAEASYRARLRERRRAK